jgi:hypothetical protein
MEGNSHGGWDDDPQFPSKPDIHGHTSRGRGVCYMIFRTDVFIVLLPNLKVNFYLEEDV